MKKISKKHKSAVQDGVANLHQAPMLSVLDEKVKATRKLFNQTFIGFQRTRILSLGIHLGIFDALHEKCMSAEEVAETFGLDVHKTNYFLGYAAKLGLVEYNSNSKKFKVPDEIFDEIKFQGGHACYLTGVCSDFHKYKDVMRKSVCFFNLDRSLEYIRGVTIASKPTYLYLFDKIFPQIPELEKKLNDGISVLEPGFGGGFGLITLAKRYPNSQFYGVDISEEIVKFARDNLKKEAKVTGNIKLSLIDGDYRKEKFDLVYFCMSLHEFSNPVESLIFYRKLMKSNADLVIVDGKPGKSFDEDYNEVDMLIAGVLFDEIMQGTKFMSENELRKVIEDAGFVSIKKIETPDYPFINAFCAKTLEEVK